MPKNELRGQEVFGAFLENPFTSLDRASLYHDAEDLTVPRIHPDLSFPDIFVQTRFGFGLNDDNFPPADFPLIGLAKDERRLPLPAEEAKWRQNRLGEKHPKRRGWRGLFVNGLTVLLQERPAFLDPAALIDQLIIIDVIQFLSTRQCRILVFGAGEGTIGQDGPIKNHRHPFDLFFGFADRFLTRIKKRRISEFQAIICASSQNRAQFIIDWRVCIIFFRFSRARGKRGDRNGA